MLKDQWCGTNTSPTVLLPSTGIHYSWTRRPPRQPRQPCAGAANPVTGVTIGGAALDPAATYRVTTYNFLADGGDGFRALKSGTHRTTRSGGDIDALERYLAPSLDWRAASAPPALDRIDVRSDRSRSCTAWWWACPPPPGA